MQETSRDSESQMFQAGKQAVWLSRGRSRADDVVDSKLGQVQPVSHRRA